MIAGCKCLGDVFGGSGDSASDDGGCVSIVGKGGGVYTRVVANGGGVTTPGKFGSVSMAGNSGGRDDCGDCNRGDGSCVGVVGGVLDSDGEGEGGGYMFVGGGGGGEDGGRGARRLDGFLVAVN